MKTLFLIILAPFCIALYALFLAVPPGLLAWFLVAVVGCDPGLAILFALAVAVPWACLLPLLFD